MASGSGNTQTIYDIAAQAFKNETPILLITNDAESRIGQISSNILVLPNSCNKESMNRKSQQPMTTLNEQSLALLLDILVLEIMEATGETHETMWPRHSDLE